MKVLYAIQGTGNGHISRARDIVPLLKERCQLDILISGNQADVSLEHEVKYSLRGLSFIFGKKGGVDLLKTYQNSNLRNLRSEIDTLPIEEYDLVINDFEPVSAWAAFNKEVPCVSLSHQAAVLSKGAPIPKKKDITGYLILKNYAPVDRKYGFHFDAYNSDTFTPVIRKQIRDLTVEDLGHYTVYLPSYSDERLSRFFNQFPTHQWKVFSKHSKQAYSKGNVDFQPVNNEGFIESLRTCAGIVCGAGFETPAEALFLQKKVLVIPMKGQFEQKCNAAALKKMGVPVIKNLKERRREVVEEWLQSEKRIEVNYPDQTREIIEKVLDENRI